jgi:predicted ATPase/DNA-binding winged helix-turn-helix (wHTH) protein
MAKHGSFERESAFSFGGFRLSRAERRLSKDETPIELGGRAFDILLALTERAGQVVSKNELLDIVWPDTTVEEGSLRFQVASLRKALGDGEQGAKFITTVYGGGYCFVAPIERSNLSVQRPPPKDTPADVAYRLPLYPSQMIGRDEDLGELVAQVRGERFVTIVGSGGIGKTMLAVAAGRALLAEFDDEVVFFDLAPIHDARLLPGAIASTLGLMQSDDPLGGLIAYLRDRRTLLILDSCEHLIGEAARLAERLSEASDRTYILATSREALRVQGEHLRPLLPLAYPPSTTDLTSQQILSFPAAQLLVDRVAAGGYSLDLDGTQSLLVAEICRSLDGIPLAIELAAGSIGAFGLQETAARLNSRIELLWQGRRTAPPRHQTLGAALDWSYHLLNDVEKAVLRRLSAFAGNFSLDAARAVASGTEASEDHVVTALTSLVAKSLVTVHAGGAATSYRLLDTTRTYAQSKLIDSGEAEQTSLKHAVYFLALLETAGAGPPSPQDGKVFSNFGMHLGNVRAALDWSFRRRENIGVALPLAAASGHLFMELSLLTECRSWAERAIALLDETTRGSRLEMELQAAFGFAVMHLEGNSTRSVGALERSLMLAEKLGNLPYQLRLLSRLHLFHSRLGQFRTALEYAYRFEPVAREIGHPLAMAEAHTYMGASRLFEGDSGSARRHFEAALVELPVSSQVDAYHFGALDFRARVRIALAQALWLQGLADQSLAIAEETVTQVRAFNHPVTVCIVLVLAIRLLLGAREFDAAGAYIDPLIEVADRNSLLPYQTVAKALRGELHVEQGNPIEGVVQLRAALGVLHTIRYEIQTTSLTMTMAKGLAAAGRHEAALDLVRETIEMIERRGDLYILPELLRVQGSILMSAPEDQAVAAEACFQGALDLAAQQGALAWQLRAAASLARLRRGLGRRDEARSVLAPVFGRLTEGFESADASAARQLLRELD